MNEKKVNIGGKEITISRLNLKGWSQLDEIKREMDISVSRRNFTAYYEQAIKFIDSVSSCQGIIDWSVVPWFDFLDLYTECVILNSPTLSFPILDDSRKKEEKLPWEYKGRTWFFWLNLFAESYGWSEFEVSNMDIDTAIGLYQEIVIEDQLQKEWEWGLSEHSYEYVPSTKSSKFRPLKRPLWMLPIAVEPKKIKIRKDMMPVGNVIRLQDEAQKRMDGRKDTTVS